MASVKKKKNPQLKEKLSSLKDKQDNWMKQRANSLNNDPPSGVKPNSSKKSHPAKSSQKGAVNSSVNTMLWNTGASNSSYSGFVVRKPAISKKESTGGVTNRSRSSYSSGQMSARSVTQFSDNAKDTKGSKLTSTPLAGKSSFQVSNKLQSAEDSLALKINDFFEKSSKEYKHEKYSNFASTEKINSSNLSSVSKSILGEITFDKSQDNSTDFMANHCCLLCHNVMICQNNAPQIVHPCGHSFCLVCLSGQRSCPSCSCTIMAIEQNETLLKVIQKYQDDLSKREKEKQEKETKKYLDEYQSLSTRSKVMKAEATEIIDKMEEVTLTLCGKKNNISQIENTASDIKEKIKMLQMELQSLEEQHHAENESVTDLETEYENFKKQLLMVEKTLTTLKQSKDRVKMMMENLTSFNMNDSLSN